jgi:hypothetical protein
LPSNSQEQKVYNNGQDLDCGLMGLDKAGGWIIGIEVGNMVIFSKFSIR